MNFISVSDFCKKYGKDPGNVRRLILAGRIPAQKVGSQWIIPEDAAPPEDGRVKSGKYKNWRSTQTEKPEQSEE